jgi:hypothetical protein
MRQEGVDLRFGHLGGVADAMEVDEPLDPQAVRLLGAAAVMTRLQGLT